MFFANQKVRKHKLPPKISSNDNGMINIRRIELETYMKSLMNLKRYPESLMEFIQFKEYNHTTARIDLLDEISLFAKYSDIKSEFQDMRVRVIDNKPK